MSVRIFHYPACDTCRRATRWLAARGVEVERVHIVDEPPTREALAALWRISGLPLRKLFNTAGRSYRAGGFKDRLPTMSEAEALDALSADGKLIKRPVLDGGSFVLVGFDEGAYEAAFP
jgi:arsenate reductase